MAALIGAPRYANHARTLLGGLPPLRGLLPLALALLAWELSSRGPSPYFPPPSAWWAGLVSLTAQNQLLPALAATLQSLALSLAIAIAAAVILGLAIGVWAPLRRATDPLLEFLRALPPPAIVPIAVLLIGYEERMKLTVVALSAVWPILLNTASAVGRIDPLLLDVGRSLRLSRRDQILRIVAPAVVPDILLGIRVAVPLAIVVTLLVEILTAVPGIGALMIAAQRNFQAGQVYGLLVLVGLVGLIVNSVFAMLEAGVLRRWPPRAASAP